MSEPAQREPALTLAVGANASLGQAKRGKLKVFLGYAPGVGKTYRMLQAARDLAAFERCDVVVGIVDTHQRRETAALVLGLEILPRKRVRVGDAVVEEFDLDSALARRPQVIVVDELAHTNTQGARHVKRWQDIEELLWEGIDVFTTANIQNIETLNDIVYQITHVQERETVPDVVLDTAQAIELIDIAPEELLARLRGTDLDCDATATQVQAPLMQVGDLLALRELALRRTAQRVDEEAIQYRKELGLLSSATTGEKLLVCVGPAPSSARLVRAAARLAAGLRCAWVAAYVEPTSWSALPDSERERLESHLRLAESLGATVARLSRNSVAEALLFYAQNHQVSRLLIGKPTHSRWRDRLRGSLVDEVVRGSGDIDVYVISGTRVDEPQRIGKLRTPARVPWKHYAVSVLLVLVTLGLALFLHAAWKLPDPEMLFLIAVMVVAVWFGRGPALLTAALGVGAYDFFFVPPYLTFAVSERRYILTFVMMFVTGLVLSELTARIRRQERDALAREESTAVLYALSRELSSADSAKGIAAIAAGHGADLFDSTTVVLQVASDGELTQLGAYPEGGLATPDDLRVGAWAIERLELSGLGTGNLPDQMSIGAPLRLGGIAMGALLLFPRQRRPLRADQREFLDVFCRQIAVALERVRLTEEARTAAIRAKTEEMRASLLSSVSHDLRTPLASITGAATVLRDDDRIDPSTRLELVESICDEAERLERLVRNLLDMTRLESGAIRLRREWVPIEELVGSALSRLDARLSAHDVHVDIPGHAPLVYVDPVVFEQVFVNLFENAAKYSPPGSSLHVIAHQAGDTLTIDVVDSGPGVPVGFEERIFEKFYRGQHEGPSGAGLGLAICRGIAEAHGGTIVALPKAGSGLSLRLTVPLGGTPPATTDEEVSLP